jgi:hypothetical protein
MRGPAAGACGLRTQTAIFRRDGSEGYEGCAVNCAGLSPLLARL